MSDYEIIIIDDDRDDCDFFETALEELRIEHPIRCFHEATIAFTYLKSSKKLPFLIICDINMPGLNGLEFKELINSYNDVRLVSIPFVFISTSANPVMLRFAKSLNIQGYFEKPTSMKALKDMMLKIVNYWESTYQVLD